jgi:ribosomal protein L15
MPIYLRHPKHGTKVATMEMEAEYDERSGWERFDPTEETVAEPADNAIVKTRKRRTTTPEV